MAPKEKEDLAPIDDPKMVRRYLRYAIELRELVSCFIDDAKISFECLTLSFESDQQLVELEITEECFRKMGLHEFAALDRAQSDIRLSYAVNEVTFYAHAQLQGRSARKLLVRIDLPIFKLQRREALRIRVLPSHRASVELDAGQAYLVHDISAGGLSFLIPFNQEGQFQKGQAFPKAKLSFVGKEIPVSLEVKAVLASGKNEQSWKVGLSFKSLPAAVEQMIAREAYLHTHKIWSRWL